MAVGGWVGRLLVCVTILAGWAAFPRESRGGDFAIWLMSEHWSGLTGVVERAERRFDLGPQLWQVVALGGVEGQSQPGEAQAADEFGRERTAARLRREASRAKLAPEAIFPTFPDPAVRATGLPAKTAWRVEKVPHLVGVRIRGASVEYRGAPRQSRVLAGDHAGAWLGYLWREGDPESGATLLRLQSEPLGQAEPGQEEPSREGPRETAKETNGTAAATASGSRREPGRDASAEGEFSTEWRLVDVRRSIGGRGGRVAEFQFEVRQRIRFTLEAARRPGWFLALIDGELRLSRDPALRQLVEVDQWWFYDDQEDGR
ncbi:MAG: hypothetical protein ACKOGA_02995 [Planctomycetaceae bacterium]